MARITLGAFVTDIRGSIADFTIRKNVNGLIMYKKNSRQNRGAQNKNSVSLKNAFYFKSWNDLALEQKLAWQGQASIFPFYNKEGKHKYLTGRQLFFKLNTQLQNYPNVLNPSGMHNSVESPIIGSVSFSATFGSFSINLLSTIETSTIVFSATQVSPGTMAISSKSLLRFYTEAEPSNISFNVKDGFTEKFPFAAIGQKFQVNAFCINQFGFMSPISSMLATIT